MPREPNGIRFEHWSHTGSVHDTNIAQDLEDMKNMIIRPITKIHKNVLVVGTSQMFFVRTKIDRTHGFDSTFESLDYILDSFSGCRRPTMLYRLLKKVCQSLRVLVSVSEREE